MLQLLPSLLKRSLLSIVLVAVLSAPCAFADVGLVVVKNDAEAKRLGVFTLSSKTDADGLILVTITVSNMPNARLTEAALRFADGDTELSRNNLAMKGQKDGTTLVEFSVDPKTIKQCQVDLFVTLTSFPVANVYRILLESYLQQGTKP